jgi:hypothetical protein
MDKCRRGSQFEPFTHGDREAQSLVARGKALDDELTEKARSITMQALADQVDARIKEIADDAKTDDDGVLRSFDTGATRDTGGNKLVFNKFLSAQAIEQYCRYMNMNRLQSDGKLRDGDNWTTMKHGRKKNSGETMSFRHGNMKWNTLADSVGSSSILLAICMSG